MSDDLTARDVIARTLLSRAVGGRDGDQPAAIDDEDAPELADALLAVLAAAGKRIVDTDDWEWGVRWTDGTLAAPVTQEEVSATLWAAPHAVQAVVRRRPAGPCEVVPDAR